MGRSFIIMDLFFLTACWCLSFNSFVRAFSGGSASQRTTTSTAYTSAILKVSYDGTLFNGWSAANDGSKTTADVSEVYQPRRYGRARRNKYRPSIRKGEVRSVEGSLKWAFSKIYGNVPMQHIIVEGCSRTDKGVHSKSTYALVYCLKHDDSRNPDGYPCPIEGKKLPHPRSPTDDSFKVLPFESDLQHMLFALNKMLPPDVRVLNASPMPTKEGTITNIEDSASMHKSEQSRPFHPSLDTIRKTYRYTFSVGEIYDPIRSRDVWNVPYCTQFDLERARECARKFIGTNDFIAYRGAFRGNERGKTQDTFCTLFDIRVHEEERSIVNEYAPALYQTYTIEFVGDRFLYKMVRFLVGTIVQYATSDRISLEDIIVALNTGRWATSTRVDEEHGPPRFCAPPHGLSLSRVEFNPNWKFDWIVDQQSIDSTAREHSR